MINKEYITKSLAHAHFTFCMIQVKHFLLYPAITTFQNAILQTCKAISYKDNWEAWELFDDQTEDIRDYSVSKFMDDLISGIYSEYSHGLKNQINQIANFRIKMVQRNNKS